MESRNAGPVRRAFLITCLVVGTGCLAFSSSMAFPQSAVEDEIMDIEENYYFEGNYREAIILIDRILDRPGLSAAETVEARSLKARCLINLNQVEEARGLIEQNLDEDPNWSFDPTMVLEREYAIYQDVRQKRLMAQTGANQSELQQMNSRIESLERENQQLRQSTSGGKKFYENWWFGLLTAAAAGGIVAAIVSGGDEDNPPDPPGPTTGTVSISIPTTSKVVGP